MCYYRFTSQLVILHAPFNLSHVSFLFYLFLLFIILSVVSPQPHPTIFHPGNMSPDSLTALHQNTPIKSWRGICPINEIALCATACPELARKRAVLQACLSQGQV